jgi:hypothetical protein
VFNARPESLLSRLRELFRWGWVGLKPGGGDNAVMIGLLHCRSYRWGNTMTGFDSLLLLTLLRSSLNVGRESAVCDLMDIMMSEGNRHAEVPED